MKHLLTIINCLLALNLSAQEVVVEYPFNPDSDSTSDIGVEDLMAVLAEFGTVFEVEEVMIDSLPLSQWISLINQGLYNQGQLILELQYQIDSLENSSNGDVEMMTLHPKLECVEHGAIPSCPQGNGINPAYPLVPDDNYTYWITSNPNPVPPTYHVSPIWRKFQLLNCPIEEGTELKFRRFRSQQSNIWMEEQTIEPLLEEGGVYFWIHNADHTDVNSCESGLEDIIPLEHAFRGVGEYDAPYELFYEVEGHFIDTGIRFRVTD